MALYGSFKYGEKKYGLDKGYVILLRADSAPVAGVDAPIASLADSAESATLDMTALALLADTDYFGAVVPFNESGFADPPATFALRTDALGKPALAPAAVTNLRAVALAGGKAEITWDYVEPNPLAVADNFTVLVNGEVAVVLSHTPPQRHYRYQHPPMPDGLQSVTVKALRAGVSSPLVSVSVRTDATPPADATPAISAT